MRHQPPVLLAHLHLIHSCPRWIDTVAVFLLIAPVVDRAQVKLAGVDNVATGVRADPRQEPILWLLGADEKIGTPPDGYFRGKLLEIICRSDVNHATRFRRAKAIFLAVRVIDIFYFSGR